jgi:hypothetical protein
MLHVLHLDWQAAVTEKVKVIGLPGFKIPALVALYWSVLGYK